MKGMAICQKGQGKILDTCTAAWSQTVNNDLPDRSYYMLSSRRIIILSSKIIFVIMMQSRLGDGVYKLFVCTKKKLMVGWVKDLGGGGRRRRRW